MKIVWYKLIFVETLLFDADNNTICNSGALITKAHHFKRMVLVSNCIWSNVKLRDFRNRGHTAHYNNIIFIDCSYKRWLTWFERRAVYCDQFPSNTFTPMWNPLLSINCFNTIHVATVIKATNSIEHIAKGTARMRGSWFAQVRACCPHIVLDIIHHGLSISFMCDCITACNTKYVLISKIGKCGISPAIERFSFRCLCNYTINEISRVIRPLGSRIKV